MECFAYGECFELYSECHVSSSYKYICINDFIKRCQPVLDMLTKKPQPKNVEIVFKN